MFDQQARLCVSSLLQHLIRIGPIRPLGVCLCVCVLSTQNQQSSGSLSEAMLQECALCKPIWVCVAYESDEKAYLPVTNVSVLLYFPRCPDKQSSSSLLPEQDSEKNSPWM